MTPRYIAVALALIAALTGLQTAYASCARAGNPKAQEVEIAKAENLYRPSAMEAASRLAERFAWSLEARNARRNAGHVV